MARLDRAKPEAAVRVRREYAAKVHLRLDGLLLDVIEAVFIGLPDVQKGTRDRAPFCIRDLPRYEKRLALAVAANVGA